MASPPDELVEILRPHLAKVGPAMHLPNDGGVVLYTLYVQGAVVSESGAVTKTGDGTLIGPLDLAKRDMIYAVYGCHIPELRERLENAVAGKLLIVTCEVTCGGDERGGSTKRTHYALLALP